MHINCVPDAAYVFALLPPAITVTTYCPFMAVMFTVRKSLLMPVTAAVGTVIALVELGAYPVTLTDKILVNRAVPEAVPSEVGRAVATPLLPLTAIVPYHVVMTDGCVGAPLAVEEKLVEPA